MMKQKKPADTEWCVKRKGKREENFYGENQVLKHGSHEYEWTKKGQK